MSEDTQSKPKIDKEYQDALNFLDLDSKTVTSKALIAHKVETNIQEKVTQIDNFAMNFRMLLEGKNYQQEDGGFKQAGIALCGKKTINSLFGIIMNYSENCNLITKKDDEKFAIQLYDAWSKQQNVLLRDRSTPERNHRVISKIFKDCLVNIGDIITNSDKNMEKIFTNFANQDNFQDPLGRQKHGGF